MFRIIVITLIIYIIVLLFLSITPVHAGVRVGASAIMPISTNLVPRCEHERTAIFYCRVQGACCMQLEIIREELPQPTPAVTYPEPHVGEDNTYNYE